MFKLLLIFILTFTLGLSKTSEDFFDISSEDLQEDLADAKDDGKKGVMIFFGMASCPFCHKMKEKVLNQDEVIEFYKKNFFVIELDIDASMEMTDFQGEDTTQKEFAKSHRVRATPVIAFFDLEGKKVFKRTGYSNLKDFKLMGKYVVDETYKTQNFIKYKRNKK